MKSDQRPFLPHGQSELGQLSRTRGGKEGERKNNRVSAQIVLSTLSFLFASVSLWVSFFCERPLAIVGRLLNGPFYFPANLLRTRVHDILSWTLDISKSLMMSSVPLTTCQGNKGEGNKAPFFLPFFRAFCMNSLQSHPLPCSHKHDGPSACVRLCQRGKLHHPRKEQSEDQGPLFSPLPVLCHLLFFSLFIIY